MRLDLFIRLTISFILFCVFVSVQIVITVPSGASPMLQSTPTARVATADEVRVAQTQWSFSRHANTYDNGQGANTTCAQCKSPRNWDPDSVAALAAEDCSACKREPGQPRPELTKGVPVSKDAWKNITCDVCHQPAGDSYSMALSYWNQSQQRYEAMSTSTELCAECHVKQHGFDVIWEQAVSPAHAGWECTRCHGSHNTPVKCTACHDPTIGRGATTHAQHSTVDCTACHDAGGLPIWQDPYPDSRSYQKYMPQRVAHALRSWTSHNLQTTADCRRCHHPQGDRQITLAFNIRCDNQSCHPNGASFNWCPVIPRDNTPK